MYAAISRILRTMILFSCNAEVAGSRDCTIMRTELFSTYFETYFGCVICYFDSGRLEQKMFLFSSFMCSPLFNAPEKQNKFKLATSIRLAQDVVCTYDNVLLAPELTTLSMSFSAEKRENKTRVV